MSLEGAGEEIFNESDVKVREVSTALENNSVASSSS